MKKFSLFSRAILGAGLAVGLATQVSATPTFTIKPSAISGAGGVFTADALSITNSSELITLSAPVGSAVGTGIGSGWANFGTYSLAGTPVLPGVSRLLVDHQLYLTFDIGVSLATGLLGLPGSTYTVTTLNYKVWGDPNLDTVFSQATNAGAAGVVASVAVGVADKLLAFGSLASPGAASITGGNGVAINVLDTFAVCTGAGTANLGGVVLTGTPCTSGIGDAYFDTPNPFHSFVFSAFNNTGSNAFVSGDGSHLAINAAGRVDFVSVPEPGSLALVGIAMLGFGASSLRKRKSE